MDRTNLKDRPVFISGHPKSGTSLLLNLLDSHSQLLVFPEETLFFRNLLPMLENTPQEKWFEIAERQLNGFFDRHPDAPEPDRGSSTVSDYSFLSVDKLRASLDAEWENVLQVQDVLGAMILAFGNVLGQINLDTRYWIEKTPLNEYYAEEIFRFWPEARVLHIVRDPRDNYSSYARKHEDWTAEFFAQEWRNSAQAGYINHEIYGSKNYLVLNYEDLVINTKETLEKICDFLEIRFEDILQQPTKVGKTWHANTMFDDVIEQVSTVPVGRWKNTLTNFEICVIEVIAYKQMKARGYPLKGKWNLKGIILGLYWRMRQKYYFSLGSGRDERGFI